MEQRDAIVKNLREISHFFLSDNKQASAPETDSTQEEQTSLSQTLPAEEKILKTTAVTKPVVSKAFFAASDNLPKIYHVIHHDNNKAIIFWPSAIAYDLTQKGHKTCVVGDKKSMAEVVGYFKKNGHGVTKEDNQRTDILNCDVYYINNSNNEMTLTLIGREDYQSGANLSPYMNAAKSVFITDFSLEYIQERLQDNHLTNLVCFSKPNPEKAFELYVRLRNMINISRNIWSGIIIYDVNKQPEAHRVYSSIAETLSKYSKYQSFFLGHISPYTNGSVHHSVLNNAKAFLDGKISISDVSDHFIYDSAE